jgi:hypothetical protein
LGGRAHRLPVAYSLAWFAPPSESHVDWAAAISLRPVARCIPARSTSWIVKYGLSVAGGVNLPMAAWFSTTSASMMCVMTVPLSARESELLVVALMK